MPSSNPALRYQDILDYIDAIDCDLEDMTFNEFTEDTKTQRSVIYSLQCISEAAIKLGLHAEEHAPDPDWRNIRGFGNVARHDYGEVNLNMVWEIVEDSLPSLQQACRDVLIELDEHDPERGPRVKR